MSEAKFRVWFGSSEASEDDLARIEEIEVTQEMDKFWEARMRTTMCLDAQGRWQHRPDTVATAFSRVRVELDPGNGRFVPLIDGPVFNFESMLDSQPGRSTATFAVRDDSVLLNREEGTEIFRDKTDSQVADQVLRSIDEIDPATRIEPTATTHPVTTRRGTKLLFLGQLASVNRRRVYVLPGPTAGSKSIGCFLSDPRVPTGELPALRLIGDDRNVSNAQIEEDSEAPERTHGSTLRLSDGVLNSFNASSSDLRIDGDRPAVPPGTEPLRLLPPAAALHEASEDAATAQAGESAYAFKLTSSVIPGCYAAVLTPYVKVRVECGSTPYSGNYLIKKVVHRITPSLYSQSFEAKSDGSTEVPDAPVAEAPGGGLSISFSASVGVF
jgi:hypothetical protein